MRANSLFSVEPLSRLNFDGPEYDGFAVVRRAAGVPPQIMGVYMSPERAQSVAERLRNEDAGSGDLPVAFAP